MPRVQYTGWVGADEETVRVDTVRIDQWLCASRMFKSRTQAAHACDAGDVRVNGGLVRPSGLVRVGDEIRAKAPRGDIVLGVKSLATKRLSPPLARELYDDRTPPPPPETPAFAERDRGAGRPTKRERREMLWVRGTPDDL